MLNLLKKENFDLKPIEFYSRNFDHTFEMAFHKHEYIEIMYAKKGGFSVLFLNDDKSVNEQKIIEGCFIVIDSILPHKLVVTNNSRIVNLEITLNPISDKENINISKILSSLDSFNLFINELQKKMVFNDTENLLFTIEKIHKCLRNDDQIEEHTYQIQTLMLDLFLDILKCYKNSKYKVTNYHLYRVLNIIHNRLNEDITPKKIGNFLGISESYLHRIFSQEMKQTLSSYINELRIEKAKQLLVKTSYPIVDISAEVGYKNRQYFGKSFKKLTGFSPYEFRLQYKNKEYTIAKMEIVQEFLEKSTEN